MPFLSSNGAVLHECMSRTSVYYVPFLFLSNITCRPMYHVAFHGEGRDENFGSVNRNIQNYYIFDGCM